MKKRVLFVISLLATSMLLPISPVGAVDGDNCDLPAPAPGLILLEPTSSTDLAPGESVELNVNYMNVQPHPSSVFYFQDTANGEVAVDFYPSQAGSITIPDGVAPGAYELTHIETRNSVGWVGDQQRDHSFVGTSVDGSTLSGTSCIDFAPLDLHVSAA